MIKKCETEIDAIRIRLHEEKSNLTRDERIKKANDTARKLAAEYSFTIVSSARRTPPKLAANA